MPVENKNILQINENFKGDILDESCVSFPSPKCNFKKNRHWVGEIW